MLRYHLPICCLLFALLMASPAPASTAFAQQNTGFETARKSDSDQPAHWTTAGEGYEVTLTDETAYEGRRSLRMKGSAPDGSGIATQAVAADSLMGERLRLSGHIKTRDVARGFAGLWVRVDGPEGMLAFENMSRRGVAGTTSWTRYEIEVPVPQEAERVLFGALMPGSGTAWFDTFKLEALQAKDLPPPSGEAKAYLNRAIDIMEERSINRDSIDRKALRAATMHQARGTETTADTYSALRYAIGRLGDNHSFLILPEPSARRYESDKKEQAQATAGGALPHGTLLSETVGYINVPSFAGDSETGVAFADSLQNIIATLDRKGVCGWIVDLRSNQGGNMWPMLAGLGPVLGEGNAGTFVGPEGSETDWWYRDGQAGVRKDTLTGARENTVVEIDRDPHTLQRPRPPVAVLTGRRTASSGEAIAVSFRGRPEARSFGRATRGLSTSNATIPLSDGATLMLTTATFADRTGMTYGEALEPDMTVKSDERSSSLSEDPVVKTAQSWLEKQARCSSQQ